VIREPRGDYSRLRSQASRKHDLAWWSCGEKELTEDRAQPSEGILQSLNRNVNLGRR